MRRTPNAWPPIPRPGCGERPPTDPRAARGVALFIVLALLTAMTVATLAAAQTTVLELAMARNDEDARRAFHGAEAALAEARAWLRSNAADPAALFTNAGGLYAPRAYGEPAPWRLDVWARDASRSAAAAPGLPEAPRYVIEWLTTRNADDPDRPPPAAPVDVYRITARATGASAVVLLQCTYGQTRDGGASRLAGTLSWAQLDAPTP